MAKTTRGRKEPRTKTAIIITSHVFKRLFLINSLGVKKGLEYVESLKGTDAIFVTKDDKVYISKDIEGNFEIGKDSGYTMGNRADLK